VELTEEHRQILAWASSPDPMFPCEDWDIIVTGHWTADLLLELASDDGHAKQDTFLQCLYLLTGDAVRSNYDACSKEQLTGLVERALASGSPWAQRWATDTKALMLHPESFNYWDWCGGNIARRVVGGL
jgi:hypothetical protein